MKTRTICRPQQCRVLRCTADRRCVRAVAPVLLPAVAASSAAAHSTPNRPAVDSTTTGHGGGDTLTAGTCCETPPQLHARPLTNGGCCGHGGATGGPRKAVSGAADNIVVRVLQATSTATVPQAVSVVHGRPSDTNTMCRGWPTPPCVMLNTALAASPCQRASQRTGQTARGGGWPSRWRLCPAAAASGAAAGSATGWPPATRCCHVWASSTTRSQGPPPASSARSGSCAPPPAGWHCLCRQHTTCMCMACTMM